MKKNLLGWLAMATMLVGTGCSSDEVVNDYSPENAIQFDTYLGRDAESRASVFETSDMYSQGFGVYAYYTGQTTWHEYVNSQQSLAPNFMNNTKVTSTNSGTSWEYAPVKYWPNTIDDKVSFFAYAPWSAGGDNALIKANNGVISFKVDNTVKNQVDLTAVTSFQTDKTNNDRNLNTKVTFDFQHVLSRIEFTLQAAVDQVDAGGNITAGTTITLNKIVIGDAENDKFYVTGDYSILKDEWSNFSGNQSFTLTTNNFVADSNVLNENKNSQQSLIGQNSNDYIMIIPGTITDLPVYVEYTVVTNGNNEAGVTDNTAVITNKVTTTISSITFDQGKKYKLNIVLGMNKVKLSATVSGWDTDGGSTQVNLPLNINNTSN